MIILAILTLAILFLVASAVLPCWVRLALAVPLSVPQLYLPGVMIGGYPPPLALLSGLLLWPEFLKGLKFTLAWRPTQMLFVIAGAYTVSLSWSADLQSGVRALAYFWLFLSIFTATVIEGRRNYLRIIKILECTVIFAAVEAVAIIIFRLVPITKIAYLHSPLASLFINRNMLDSLFTVAQNNVFDPTKSGGLLFVNANVSGAHMGVLVFAGIGVFLSYHSKRVLYASILCLSAIFFTGSKAATILAILSVVGTVMILVKTDALWRRRINRWALMLLALSVFPLLWYMFSNEWSMGISSSEVRAFAADSDATFAIRQQIWSYASIAFFQHPLLGQGFGGWQEGFAGYARYVGISDGFPPHNTIIYLWSQGGIVAAVSGILFMLSIIYFSMNRLRANYRKPSFGTTLAMFGAFCWVFIHGMGENFGLLGDEHMTPVLAVLLALAYLDRNKNVLGRVRVGDEVSS